MARIVRQLPQTHHALLPHKKNLQLLYRKLTACVIMLFQYIIGNNAQPCGTPRPLFSFLQEGGMLKPNEQEKQTGARLRETGPHRKESGEYNR